MIVWTVAAAVALLWPATMIGALDGIPLDGRLEAVVIGLAVPVLWWLDRAFLGRAFARIAIVALLGWKALMTVAMVQHGLCAKFTTAAPFAGEVLAIPVDEPRGILRSWDVRAGWRSSEPACTAIVDRSYNGSAAFPSWFLNLVDSVRPGPRDITLDLTGYVRASEPGTFALRVGTDMHLEGTMDGVALDTRSGRAEAQLTPGVHHLVAHASLTGEEWRLVPMWNGAEAWDALELMTAPPARSDRVFWPLASSITAVLVWLLVAGWSVSALAGFRPRVIGWSAVATAAAVVCAQVPRLDRLAGVALIGVAFVPLVRSDRRFKSACLLLGMPWLAFFAVRSLPQVGHTTAYPVDGWLAFQVAASRIFMKGFWLMGGAPAVASIYQWIIGALHVVFGDSSIGEVYWDAVCILAGALLCVRLVKSTAGFAWGLLAGSLMLATCTIGTPWHLFGRGVPEITAAGFGFASASYLLRARLGRRSAAVAAGVFAALMLWTRLNFLLCMLFLPALLWPPRTSASIDRVRRALPVVNARTTMVYGACVAAGVALGALRVLFHGGLFGHAAGSAGMLTEAGHRVWAAMWMNEPPGFDPRALAIFAGTALSVLALIQIPRVSGLPFRVAAAAAGGLAAALFAHTRAYPGGLSIQIMPFAAAMSVLGLVAILPARHRAWRPGEQPSRQAAVEPAVAIDPAAARRLRWMRRAFAAVAIVLALGVSLTALVLVDMSLHQKYGRSAGFNVWGYRGPVVGRKQPGEYRVVMLGGSTAYGYGVEWNDAIPALLERELAVRKTGRFTVVNLGYNNEGAYSFAFTLRDYEKLHYDLACLYEGYNDMMGDPEHPNLSVFRHDSPIFRLTGYLPIFPIVFKEKASVMLHGDPGAGYRFSNQTVFHASLATKAQAEVLAAAAEVSQSLERQLDRATAESPRRIADADASGCKSPWAEYCSSIATAVDYALGHNHQVLVVSQPHALGQLRGRHVEQQQELANMLQRRFGGDRRVRYVDLGESVDLSDPALSFDRMHLTVAGNRPVAAALVEPVLEMAALRQTPVP